jgi:putative hydrolase of the HAD superfamily
VLFDLDDTLHDDTTAYRAAAGMACTELAAAHGVDAEALAGAYVREAERFWTELRSEHLVVSIGGQRAAMWSAALASQGIDDPALAQRLADSYNRHRASVLQPFPQALPLLAALRAAGKKTAIITNGFAETHREKIALLQFDDEFDAILIADEVGMIKPDPRIFLHACELLGVPASASVMVGDRYERDIRGAMSAGLATIWLNARDERLPAGAPQPDVTATSFADVVAALGG